MPKLDAIHVEVVGADLLADGSIVRHDSETAGAIAMDLARRGRARRLAA